MMNDAQEMTDLSIAYDGSRYYYYESYRYERLEDAVRYARLQRSRTTGREKVATPIVSMNGGPTADERKAMAAMRISYANGIYVWRDYRYDRLADAFAYANLSSRASGK
jgi:hypothetical protein